VTIDCSSPCHVGHGILQGAAANVNICQACHVDLGIAGDLPMDSAASAVPGVSGTSHAFDVAAVNAEAGAQMPLDTAMQRRIMDAGTKIACSTCHDQHNSNDTFGGRLRVSQPRLSQGTLDVGDGSLTSGGAYAGSAGAWYELWITTAGNETTAQLQYRSYTEAGGWTAWAGPVAAGTDVGIGNGVTVSFGAGSYDLDDHWELSAAWPFLRAELDAPTGEGSVMCIDCHRSWAMDHTSVESYDGSYKSHPVGVGLNANSQGYDRIPPLDGNGGAAGSDGIASNDLKLDGNSNVQCLTCHGIHYVDSNTQTEDGP
jgi:hypothetical protein